MARIARYPLGPWSKLFPEVIFDGRPSQGGPTWGKTADTLEPGHQFVGRPHTGSDRNTVCYAPHAIPTWTRFDHSLRRLTLYYTLSVEDSPYNSQLMCSRITYPP